MKLDVRNLLIGLFFAAVVPTLGVAEVQYRALVTLSQSKVNLYEVDENDTWTLNSTVFTKTKGSDEYPVRAVFASDGNVYVSDIASSDYSALAGRIHKVNLSGTRLSTIAAPFCVESLAVTPDAKTIFGAEKTTGYGTASEQSGRIFKYDVASATWTLFADVSGDGGNHSFRDMAIDESGHLFVSDQSAGCAYFFDTDDECPVTPYATITVSTAQSIAWNRDDGLVYVISGGTKWYTVNVDGTGRTEHAKAGTDPGMCLGADFINGKLHLGTYATTGNIYKLSDGIFSNVASISSRLSSVSSVSMLNCDFAWHIDEGAGASRFTCAALPGSPIRPRGGLSTTAGGVSGRCAFFRDACTRGVLERSSDLIPATGDFSLFFWVALPAAGSATGERHLFSNATGESGDFAVLAAADNTLGLLFAPAGGGAPTSVTTDGVVADGSWHCVGVVRRGGAVELWLDGVRRSSTSVAATDAIAQTADWRIGSDGLEASGFLGTGSCIDEVSFSQLALLPGECEQLAARYSPGAVPAAADPLPSPRPLPGALGSEIAHAYACEAPFGAPSFVVDSSGVYWVAVGPGDEDWFTNATTRVFRSVDSGVTWTEYGTIDGAGVSLFCNEGALCAVGLSGKSIFKVWTDDGQGVFAEAAAAEGPSGVSYFAMGGDAVVKSSRLLKPIAVCVTNVWKPAYVSFPVASGQFSAGSVTITRSASYFINLNAKGNDGNVYTTLSRALGGTVVDSGSVVRMFWPFIDEHSPSYNIPLGPERSASLDIYSNGNFENYRVDQFRGGAKPFTIRYDDVAKMYWTVVSPVTNQAQVVDANPADVKGTLAVYSSPDLQAWYPCGTIADLAPGDGGFLATAFAVDGDDLVMASSVAVDDGMGVPIGGGNYMAFRRIAGFRSVFTPYEPDKNRMFISDSGTGNVFQYYRTPDGEWQPGGILHNKDLARCTWTEGGTQYTMINPCNIAVRGDKVYILNGRARTVRTSIFVYSRRGKLLDAFISPLVDGNTMRSEGMDVSHDGTYALVLISTSVVKVDFSTREWTTLVTDATHLPSPREVAIDPDGFFYVSNAASGGSRYVSKFAADGTYQSNVLPGNGDARTALSLDYVNGFLYCGHTNGKVIRVNLLDTSETTTIEPSYIYDLSGTASVSTIANGMLFVTSDAGWISAYSLATLEKTAPFATLNVVKGIAYAQFEHNSGIIMLIK